MLNYNLLGRPVEIITPQRLLLKGFLFSPSRAKTLFIFVHGLGGSLFSRIDIAQELAKSGAAVLVFNNRGFGLVNGFRRLSNKTGDSEPETMGKVHELFTDCVDDLEGAVRFGISAGCKKIILVGHSTGCNKIAYYLSRKNPVAVKGAIFFGPMSDYAFAKKNTSAKKLSAAEAYARRLTKAGRGGELLPVKIWPEMVDARRFLSLYTPGSIEEIFSYAAPDKKLVVLQKTRKPLLIVLAENDEFGDRPVKDIAKWFQGALQGRPARIKIIKKSGHSFSGCRRLVKKIILAWMDEIG